MQKLFNYFPKQILLKVLNFFKLKLIKYSFCLIRLLLENLDSSCVFYDNKTLKKRSNKFL